MTSKPIIQSALSIDSEGAWLRGVRKIISPNCDPRPSDTEIDLLVIHSISLPPGEFGGGYIDQLFTNALEPSCHAYFAKIKSLRVSAHLLIDRCGALTQYVSFRQRAWHAGESTFQGRPACNDYSIGLELEGCDEQAFTEAQYNQLIAITKVLMAYWPSLNRQRIVGHGDIAPTRKSDPGPRFDWDYYYACL